jgi:hypothetical protein
MGYYDDNTPATEADALTTSAESNSDPLEQAEDASDEVGDGLLKRRFVDR